MTEKNSILDGIKSPKDLKNLNIKELKSLSDEIRAFLIDNISKTGGHLASNLGVVELTIALHRVFDSPKDKFIFDVGHQSYVHKILTGRCEKFPTLRTKNGLSGFPKRSESIHDIVNTGHSSTSISSALGICRARDLKNEDFNVLAIIGDGALTGGMAFEALNDAASSGTDITIILNDNGMAISKSVGALSKYLTKIRTRRTYKFAKKEYEKILRKIPYAGRLIIRLTESIKTLIKLAFLDDVIFEKMGFVYLGAVDGHDIKDLTDVLENSRDIKKPKIIHVLTQKGKGYSFAEDRPDSYHGVAPFTVITGLDKSLCGQTYTDVAADTLLDLMDKDDRITVVTAAMMGPLKLGKIYDKYKSRIFDAGIAEQHCVTMASGMAIEGYKPVVTIYSTFLQRAYDQILHDVVLNSLPVLFLVDRAGLVGEDGETHHGIYDLAFFSSMPDIVIMAPASRSELQRMIRFALGSGRPAAVRYPKEIVSTYESDVLLRLGETETVREGRDITLISAGPLLSETISAADELKKCGIDAEIINSRFIKPLNAESVLRSALKTGNVITLEDGVVEGGLGSRINSILKNSGVRVMNMGIENNHIITQATRRQLLAEEGLNMENIIINVKYCLYENK